MKEEAFLLDVLFEEDYLKVVTDEGNFLRPTNGTNNDKLAVIALKLVGERVEILFQDSAQAFAGEFEYLSGVEKKNGRSSLPFNKAFPAQKSQKIFGPPGTGKTTKLIGYVKDAVEAGVKPDDIAFISFSNGAASVAKTRVVEALPEFGKIDFQNFSTMHSLATRIGGHSGKKLMVEEHFKAFDNTIDCWREWTELGNPLGAVERYSHPVLDTYNLSLASQKRVGWKFPSLNDGEKEALKHRLRARYPALSRAELPELCEAYVKDFLRFKQERALITFDDVIEAVASTDFEGLIPTFELLIIDEAQDLSNHLWILARKLINAAKITYIAGDDDQAIMMGIGANPREFVAFPASEQDEPLLNSYRIPKSLRDYVDRGIMPALEKLPDRVGVTWEANDKEVGYVNCGSSSVEKDVEGNRRVINREFTPEALIRRVQDQYRAFKEGSAIISDAILLDEGRQVLERTLFHNKIYYIPPEEMIARAQAELKFSGNEEMLKKIATGELSAARIILFSYPDREIQDLSRHSFLKPDMDVPDWLIMAPTKRTGEQLSASLRELNIPHFYRNKPILDASKTTSLIRVQTVHMSKGDEAKNAAVVVAGFGDVAMLGKDPRLAYVAATRASQSCYPRVCAKGLLPKMSKMPEGKIPWRKFAKEYNKMFPIGAV